MADQRPIHGEIPAGVTREQVEEQAAHMRATLLEGIELFLGGKFGGPTEPASRAGLFELGRFALSRLERQNLKYAKSSHDAIDVQLSALFVACVLEVLEGGVVDHPAIIREQLVHHARRLLDRSSTFVREPK